MLAIYQTFSFVGIVTTANLFIYLDKNAWLSESDSLIFLCKIHNLSEVRKNNVL